MNAPIRTKKIIQTCTYGYLKYISPCTACRELCTHFHLKQTLEDFEERRVPVDVYAAIFHRTAGVILLIWAQ